MKDSKIRNRNQKINYITEAPSAELGRKQNQSSRGRFHLTDFQLRVLEATLRIPFGEVRSYHWIATQIGSPKAVRAVGSVLRRNPYPFIIPCHRVVKSNGDIGQYSGGKKIKTQLIQFEQQLKNHFINAKMRASHK